MVRRISFLSRARIPRRVSFRARRRRVSFIARVPSRRRRRITFYTNTW